MDDNIRLSCYMAGAQLAGELREGKTCGPTPFQNGRRAGSISSAVVTLFVLLW